MGTFRGATSSSVQLKCRDGASAGAFVCVGRLPHPIFAYEIAFGSTVIQFIFKRHFFGVITNKLQVVVFFLKRKTEALFPAARPHDSP